MGKVFEPTVGQEVFLADGRKALFAGVIEGQNFVRIMLYNDGEYGHDEWPSDKLTPTGAVFADEPCEAYGAKITEAQDKLAAIKAEADAARANVLDLRKQASDLEQAVAKYPEFATAIDFMEGRITHVTIEPAHSAPTIKTFKEAFEDTNDYGRAEGIKMLCLFGTDDRGKKLRWGLNRYRDGSGSGWDTITPHQSHEAAEQYLRDLWAGELELWLAGDKASKVHRFRDCAVHLEWPEKYLAEAKASMAEATAGQIARYEASIAVERSKSANLNWKSLTTQEQP